MLVANKIAGVKFVNLQEIYEERIIKSAAKIVSDLDNPVHYEFILLPSGRRYTFPRCKSNRAMKSFVPSNIRFLNDVQYKTLFA